MSGVMAHFDGSLGSHLQTWVTANASTISGVAWPNKEFDPPAVDGGKGWVRPKSFPAETIQATVGDSGLNEVGGIYRIDLFYPKGKAAGVPNQIADSLVSHFKRGTNTPDVSGYSARITRAWREAAQDDKANEAWYHIPVRVQWFQHVANL